MGVTGGKKLVTGGLVALAILRGVNAQPQLSITVPENGSSLPVEAATRIEARLSEGNADRVAFFVGDTPLGVDSDAPYSVDWPESDEGDYILSATAVLDNGTTVSSSTVLAKRKAVPIAPSVEWESVHTRSQGYSLLFRVLDGALYHGSNQLSSDPGLFRSVDQGESWARIWKKGGASVFHIAANDEYYYLATSSGIFRSSENDEDWEATNCPLSGSSSPLAILTVGDTVVACSQNGKISRSEDNGASWTSVHNTFSDEDLFGTSLGIITDIVRHNDHLFITSSYKGVARSSDFGHTWEPGRGDLPVNDAPKMIIGSGLAAGPSMVYVIAGSNVYGSANAGENWSLMLDKHTSAITTWGEELLAVGNAGVHLLRADGNESIDITMNVELPERISEASLAVDGEYIYLAVTPNGAGTPTLWRRPIESASSVIQGDAQVRTSRVLHRATMYDLRGRRIPELSIGENGTRAAPRLYIESTGKKVQIGRR